MLNWKTKEHRRFATEATKRGYIVEPHAKRFGIIVPSIVVKDEQEKALFSVQSGIRSLNVRPNGFRLRILPATI